MINPASKPGVLVERKEGGGKIIMKMAKLVLCLGTAAMAWASASKSYDVRLNNPAQVNGRSWKLESIAWSSPVTRR